MNHQQLREQACAANLELVRQGLVISSFGNASAFDPGSGVMAIKPSGVDYDQLTPENMVLLEVTSGKALEPGSLRPSSDTPTHLALYRQWPMIRGVVHTHSRLATAWAQAGRDIPCLGTTHADYFNGAVPCTATMTSDEITGGSGYEHNTGLVIIREFQARKLDPLEIPAVLVRNHAPFTWGKTAADAVHIAVILEYVAAMAQSTFNLEPAAKPIGAALLQKHFFRKHGPGAYYGQNQPK